MSMKVYKSKAGRIYRVDLSNDLDLWCAWWSLDNGKQWHLFAPKALPPQDNEEAAQQLLVAYANKKEWKLVE